MSCSFTGDMLTVEKIDEQTSRQGNLHYLYKVCEQRLSRKTNILVNPSTVEQVEYWRKQKSRNIYTQYTKRIKEHD